MTIRIPGKPEREEAFQADWVDRNAGRIKAWLKGLPLIFCPGNHDFYDPTDRLRAEGVTCVNLAKKRLYRFDGIPFIGLPYCPANVHPWNYAVGDEEMAKEVGRMGVILAAEGVQEAVVVAHCPGGFPGSVE